MIRWLVEALIFGSARRVLERHDERPRCLAVTTVGGRRIVTCLCRECFAACRVGAP